MTNKIRQLRLARAWFQEQLAEIAALSVRTVQRVENGERPGLETLSALAAVFEISVTELSAGKFPGEQALAHNVARARLRLREEKRFYKKRVSAILVLALLAAMNLLLSPENLWFLGVTAVWSALLLLRGIRLFALDGVTEKWQNWRLQQLLRK